MTKPQQLTVFVPFVLLCAFFPIIGEAVKDNDKNQNNQTAPQSTNLASPTVIYQNEPPVIHVEQQEFSKIVQEKTGNAAASTSNKKGGGKADGPLSLSSSVFKRPALKKLAVFKPQTNKPPQPAAGPSSTSSSSTHFQRGETKFQMLDGVEKRLLLPPKWLDDMNDNNTTN